MAFLLVENGPDAGKRYRVSNQGVTIGRHPECEILVDGHGVSRHHAKVWVEDQRYYVADLLSRNGTELNDQPIGGTPGKTPAHHELHSGDEIRVCGVAFRFVSDDADPAATLDEDESSSAFALADEPSTGSTIMSKLDLLSHGSSMQLTASTQAKLTAVLDINRSMARALALDSVLPNVLECLFRIFVQADRGFIVLKGPRGELVPRYMKTRRENSRESARISRTIVNEVLKAKEAILSADAASDNRFELSQSIADFRIRSMMCAPLLDIEGEPLGVIQIDTLDQRKRFEADDLEILAAIAAQAGIAINNAQLHEQALRRRAVERDLAIAHQVQIGFLPQRRPELDGYCFFDYYRSANDIGGDYYDYIQLPDGRVAVVVADVVGHGVAAALLMAKLSAETRFCLAMCEDAAQALTELNRRFYNPNSDRFATIVIVVVDPKTDQVAIVNGGHMAPIWRKASGELIDAGEDVSSVPIGIVDDMPYELAVIQLEPGDCLTLYTDGINEAMDAKEDQFTIERMRETIRRLPGGLAAYGKAVIDDVQRFMGEASQFDDMCLVTVGRIP
ncbi:MAG: FHA domain-containing protein [Planctomycetes bacterium]|nr:FHA domain-containing protein [Planctomycetota bacterium]